ncbi:MAG: hypothetical protein KF823_01145 [Xanthomonadales bacterium]|nr:hypothetical protein [Xanthomonadales bacterium]
MITRRTGAAALLFLVLPGALAQRAAHASDAWRDNGQLHVCTGPLPAQAAVLCVRAGSPPGGSGTAPAPYAGIGVAIAAAKAGDIIQVAGGTYLENIAIGSLASQAAKPLTLLGGFATDFTARDAAQHVATIDGGQLAPAVQLHVASAQTTTLDGFRITGGRGLGTSWQDGGGHGGGVYVRQGGNGTTVVSNNLIEGNRSNNHTSIDSRGGGIHADSQAWGGATATVRIEDNRVRDNHAGKGAGVNVVGRRAELLRNRIEDNTGHSDHGGGLYISTASTLVQHNTVAGNVIGATVGYGWGGGILVAGASADLIGNLITDNHAPTTGAGIFWDEGATGTMRNDRVVANRCPSGSRSGAGIYLDGGPGGPSIVSMENLTIAGHLCPGTAPDGAAVVIEAGSTASFRNTILWGNTREFLTLSGGSFSIVHSLTQQAGTGNLLADPLFADPAGGDYHLRSAHGRYTPGGWVSDLVTSPAIDAGDPASAFSLEPLPNGGRINLGAYGNTPQASRSAGGDLIFANGFDP